MDGGENMDEKLDKHIHLLGIFWIAHAARLFEQRA